MSWISPQRTLWRLQENQSHITKPQISACYSTIQVFNTSNKNGGWNIRVPLQAIPFYLFVHGNMLSGAIPGFLFKLPNLIKLDLSDNNFSGAIPASVNNLSRLAALYLEDNHLSGSTSEIDIPSLKQFNVSNNNLSGQIPEKLSGMPASAFGGHYLLCGTPLSLCNSPVPPHKKRLSAGAIAGIVIGCVFGVLLILTILVCLCSSDRKMESRDIVPAKHTEIEILRKKAVEVVESRSNGFSGAARAEANISVNKNFPVFLGNASKVFHLDDLLTASAKVLGKGTFGTAYKAALEMRAVVAVRIEAMRLVSQ